MPVQTRTLVPEHIIHVHDNLIPKIDFDGWTWPFVIDADDITLVSVRRGAHPCDVPVVDDGFGEGEVAQAQGEEGACQHRDDVREWRGELSMGPDDRRERK